ncbi:EexN family lipoprotein [Salmonella enterica subsp. enterica]|nr:EexN family lipoprotein [Salmonella enterica subsp. enterica]
MNMTKIILAPLAAAMLVLTGCEEKIYDVDYYVNNIKEAEQMQKQCEQGKVTNKNCENARKALEQINRKKAISSMFAH